MFTVNDLAKLSYRSPFFLATPRKLNNDNDNNYQSPMPSNGYKGSAQSVNMNLRFKANNDGDVFIKATKEEPTEPVVNNQGFFGWLFKDYSVEDHVFF